MSLSQVRKVLYELFPAKLVKKKAVGSLKGAFILALLISQI